jgi:hypothetical protein
VVKKRLLAIERPPLAHDPGRVRCLAGWEGIYVYVDTVKLNYLVRRNWLVPIEGTFPALRDYAVRYYTHGPMLWLGTLSAALQAKTIGAFFTPILPRGLKLTTAQDVWDADLDAGCLRVDLVEYEAPNLIVSRHPATIKMLRERWPSATVLDGDVSVDQVRGKVVAGTLPPQLVTEVSSYRPVWVGQYDAIAESDVDDVERITMGHPVRVSKVSL